MMMIRLGSLLMLLAAMIYVPSASAANSLNEPFTSAFTRLDHAACVTLFHRGGRIGCGTADHSLQIGRLKYFDGNLPEDTSESYVAVMEDFLLTQQSISTLLSDSAEGTLKGVLVLNSTSSDGSSANTDQVRLYSLESQTPQGYNTPSQSLSYGNYNYKWNSNGQGLFQYDLYGLPMAFVKDSDVCESLRGISQSSTEEKDEIVGEFNYYMGPDNISSKDCLQWKDVATGEWAPKCLPLGGTSVWAVAGSPPSSSNNNGAKPVIMLATNTDSTSMFHDLSPGANTAASNILATLMAAKLIGANVDDYTLGNLNKQIVFGLFHGESYGYIGSRNFLRDVAYPGFSCQNGPVASVSKMKETTTEDDNGCLYPLRHSLAFSNLGEIAGMISVDQVAQSVADGLLYVHADGDNDNFGSFLASILKAAGTDDFSVATSSAEGDGDYGYPYPPTPLTSLLQLSEGAAGGAVLTGYDYMFTNKDPYHSRLDSASIKDVNLKSIAAAATILARGALAAAYDGGDYDSDTAAEYAVNAIPELSYESDETFLELSNCLFYDGSCDMIKKYSIVETVNEQVRTGIELVGGAPLGTPPNYYAGTYNGFYGQPFLQLGGQFYGAYDGDDYGKNKNDAITMNPSQLAGTIRGLLNDFLGRVNNTDSKSCKKSSDCKRLNSCDGEGGPGATCTGGGVCVCPRAHFHMAMDEALQAAPNRATGYYEIDENDEGISAMYTEPFWASSVGVRVYRDVGPLSGIITLASGLATAVACSFGAYILKVGLTKRNLY